VFELCLSAAYSSYIAERLRYVASEYIAIWLDDCPCMRRTCAVKPVTVYSFSTSFMHAPDPIPAAHKSGAYMLSLPSKRSVYGLQVFY